MTRIMIAVILLFGSLGGAPAQPPAMDPAQEWQEFWAFQAGQESLRNVAWEAKDYAEAIRAIRSTLTRYECLSDTVRTDLSYLIGSNLYNLACAYALLDSTDRALDALDRAVDARFKNYELMGRDTDLTSLRDSPRFQAAFNRVREKYDYVQILRRDAGYDGDTTRDRPSFTYQSPSDSHLVRLRTEFRLDSVAGGGSEASRLINLMRWAHRVVRHDGNSSNPPSRNAIDLIRVCREEKRGVNCRMMATILNEAYLSMGFPSRHVTCMPKDTLDPDCHVINAVYARELGRWLWMDPTFEAYVQDARSNLLGIEDVREGLIRGDSLVVCESLNWNGGPYDGGTARYLKRYMAKNLYRFWCPVSSEFGYESLPIERRYVSLLPRGWGGAPFGRAGTFDSRDPSHFWARPEP